MTAAPRWMMLTLLAAAAYNVAWGGLAVLAPGMTLRWIGLPDATEAFWQCIGMIIGVYGVGYAIAAFDPMRHWPIVFVGLLGKVFGPIGFGQGLLAGDLPWRMGWTILTNDLIWWWPFTAICLHAWRASRRGGRRDGPASAASGASRRTS